MKKNYREQMNSKEVIVNALIELTKEKSYDDISITELAKKASIPRSSFYNYFSSKDEIIIDYMDYIKNVIANEVRIHIGEDPILVSFNVIYMYRDFYEMLVRCNKEYYLQKITLDNVEQTHPDEKERYIRTYQRGGLYVSYIEWIKRGFEPSACEMAKLINTLFSQEYKSEGTEVFINRHTALKEDSSSEL